MEQNNNFVGIALAFAILISLTTVLIIFNSSISSKAYLVTEEDINTANEETKTEVFIADNTTAYDTGFTLNSGTLQITGYCS